MVYQEKNHNFFLDKSIYLRLAFESHCFYGHTLSDMLLLFHLLCCNYSPSYEDFSIWTRESNDFKLKIMESLLIARGKPVLSKADSSLPLELF